MLIKTLISSLAIIIVGCLLHFFYGWSGKNRLVGIFSAVNESTWEHVKIALFPSFFFFIIIAAFGNLETNPEAFLVGSAVCLAIITFGIPLVYYGTKALLKKSYLAVDIANFCVMIFLGVLAFFSICEPHTVYTGPISKDLVDFIASSSTLKVFYDFPDWIVAASGLFICILILSAFLFTVFPPKFFLFKDPINKKYGFAAFDHRHHKKRHARRQNNKKKK